MKYRLIILYIALFAICCVLHAEIKIQSTQAWMPTITGSWTNSEGLSYNNTVYGDTYYNSGWQNFSGSSNIECKSIYRYFYLKPESKRNWTFSMTLTNLNAEKGYSYYANSNPNLKQTSDQIYWGFQIGYKENGNSRTSSIWIKRSHYTPPKPGVYESIYNGMLISYCVDNVGWKESSEYYPSCSPNSAPSFRIESNTYGRTYLKWGNLSITDFPVYMEELTYIKILVGTQAKVQIGKPSAYGAGVNANQIYDASDLIGQENYIAVKQKLYKSNETYYEKPAYNLAWCYLMLGEYDKTISMCNALIKYNGETLNGAYTMRGMAKEGKEDYLAALDDYQKAGEIASELYSRLYNAIYHSNRQQQPSQQQRQHTAKPANNGKPQLTK